MAKFNALQLTNVFEKFWSNSLNYALCQSHFLSRPGLSWDAILKMTKIELELIGDPNKYIFFEKGARGSISNISNRYSKANSKYLKKLWPRTKLLDAITLHCYAMPNFLLRSGFKWIYNKELDLNKHTSNSSKGWVLEVNFEYPKELQELHIFFLQLQAKQKPQKKCYLSIN